jgi:glucose uptake protein GlcU
MQPDANNLKYVLYAAQPKTFQATQKVVAMAIMMIITRLHASFHYKIERSRKFKTIKKIVPLLKFTNNLQCLYKF